MTEPEFFPARRTLTVAEIVALSEAECRGHFPSRRIADIAALDRASPRDVTYASVRDEAVLRRTKAGACFVTEAMASAVPEGVIPLVVPDPFAAFVETARALFPDAARPSSLFEAQGRFASALVHPSARLETGVTVDPGAMVGPRAEIGSGTLVGAMAVIGPGVRIGRDCQIGPGVSMTHALIGDRVLVEAGVRIGAAPVASRPPARGRVIVQDGVEIGANATIARGSIGDTVIGEGARIDTLANIASDMMIDRHCVILSGGSR
jgi:UDP-3-O-[3-hydroxymyristoyl] glucosamine N-acyltransferase